MRILKTVRGEEVEIRSVEEWKRAAPPRRDDQWQPGRSACEMAVAWCGNGPAVPEEVSSLLESHDDVRGAALLWATPEHRVRFDSLAGEPRNADLVAVAENACGRIAISVEGKADEPFDRRLDGTLADALEALVANPRSGAVRRIEQLARALLPPRGRGLPHLEGLRYQLLTGVAGAIAWAVEQEAPAAVFIVHEFVTDRTRDELHSRNAADWGRFVARLSSGEVTDPRPGQLLGPYAMPGRPLWEAPPRLYLGKAVRRTRSVGGG